MSVLTDKEMYGFAEQLIKLAFDVPAPNPLTPQIVQAAQSLQTEIRTRQMAEARASLTRVQCTIRAESVEVGNAGSSTY